MVLARRGADLFTDESGGPSNEDPPYDPRSAAFEVCSGQPSTSGLEAGARIASGTMDAHEARRKEHYAAIRAEGDKNKVHQTPSSRSPSAQPVLKHSQAADFVDAVLACPRPWRLREVVDRLRAGRYRWMSREVMEGHISVMMRMFHRAPLLHLEAQPMERLDRPTAASACAQPKPTLWSAELATELRTWPVDNQGE